MKNLKERYHSEIKQELFKSLGLKNMMQTPALEKVVLNICVSDAVGDSKKLQAAVDDLTMIAGQKAVITRAKKSIAGFKLREGMAIGAKVTLRKDRMYEFIDRLVNIALPRIRDFRGLSQNSFDGNGNYALGVKEQIIFPEINYDKVDKVRGIDIVVCTTANNNDHALALLKAINFPINVK